MNSAERADALRFVATPVDPNRRGEWRWRVIGREVQFRNRRLPHLRLDLTISEAAELRDSLCDAIFEQKSQPIIQIGWWYRAVDWLSRRTWRRKHAIEQAAALKALAEEFAKGGGW